MSGAETAQVAIERHFAHAPAKVWRALTQPWLIAEWLMANDFLLEVGHRFTLRTDPMPHWNGEVTGKVLQIEPEKRLVYAWNTEAADGTPGLRTIVSFTLLARPDGTLLRVEQAGFRADQPENLRGAQFGWSRNLDRMQAALDAKNYDIH